MARLPFGSYSSSYYRYSVNCCSAVVDTMLNSHKRNYSVTVVNNVVESNSLSYSFTVVSSNHLNYGVTIVLTTVLL